MPDDRDASAAIDCVTLRTRLTGAALRPGNALALSRTCQGKAVAETGTQLSLSRDCACGRRGKEVEVVRMRHVPRECAEILVISPAWQAARDVVHRRENERRVHYRCASLQAGVRSPRALGALIATTRITWIKDTKLPLRSRMLDLHLLTRTNMTALGATATSGPTTRRPNGWQTRASFVLRTTFHSRKRFSAHIHL